MRYSRFIYCTDTFTWRELVNQVSPSARSGALAGSVEDKIYFFGGRTQGSSGKIKRDSELFIYDISETFKISFYNILFMKTRTLGSILRQIQRD